MSIGGQDIFPVWNNRATATPQWCEGQPSSQSKTSYRIEFSVNYHFNSPITLFAFDLPIILLPSINMNNHEPRNTTIINTTSRYLQRACRWGWWPAPPPRGSLRILVSVLGRQLQQQHRASTSGSIHLPNPNLSLHYP